MQADEGSVGKQCICVACGLRTTIGATAPSTTRENVTSSRAATTQQLLSIDCPKCHKNLDYARALIGTKGLCRNCHSLILLPAAGRPPVVLRRPKTHIAFECPTCLQLFEGAQEQVGHKGRCTNCDSVFIISPLEPSDVADSPSSTQLPNATTPSKTVNNDDFLGLAPEPSQTNSPRSRTEPQPQPASSMPRPRRPVPTLKPTPKGKPDKNVPTPQPVQTAAAQSAMSNAWPDLSDLGALQSPLTVSDAYASTSVGYSGSSSNRHISIGKLFSSTTDRLFPAAFILALPVLAMFLLNIVGQVTLYALGGLMRSVGDILLIRILIAIVAITIAVVVPLAGWICFFPLQFKLANIAAKGKPVDTSMLHMPMSMRLSIIGYTIVEYILLLPLLMLGAIPMAICFALGPQNIIVIFMLLLSFLFIFYLSFVVYSMFIIGACAIADKRTIGEGIVLSFKSLFQYPLVLLPICAMEFIPMMILAVTGLGFLFIGGPYLLIRNARFYQMAYN